MSEDKSKPLKDLYAGWKHAMATRHDMPLSDLRGMFEHWGDVTAEPGGVDYLEVDAAGVLSMWAVPKNCATDRVLFCAHGGGYVLGSMYSHRKLFGHFAKAVGCRALVPNYKLAPEHLHPGPVDDVIVAYRWLLNVEKLPANRIAFIGDSAGGALAITAMLRAREKGLPLPVASVALAPYLDMEALGSTYTTNLGNDALGSREGTLGAVAAFLGDEGDRKDPLANPLYADLRGLPPILVQCGGFDVLLHDGQRFYDRAKAAGVDITLQISPEMQHVFHFLAGHLPEADAAIAQVAAWLRPRLGLT
jgi:acetyl esterase/lipase